MNLARVPIRLGGYPPRVDRELLEIVRVTAERGERFAGDVEADPASEEARALWRAAILDFRDSVRSARAAGWEREALEAAASGEPLGRFDRPSRERATARSD